VLQAEGEWRNRGGVWAEWKGNFGPTLPGGSHASQKENVPPVNGSPSTREEKDLGQDHGLIQSCALGTGLPLDLGGGSGGG